MQAVEVTMPDKTIRLNVAQDARMWIDEFMGRHRAHPLTASLDTLLESSTEDELNSRKLFCGGAILIMKWYGELTEREASALVDEIEALPFETVAGNKQGRH
ncbi:hypothetical protein ACGTN6_00930 [Halomonas sp. THAF12]|uniref:Uncharacterized protein n=1 Tax=Halomonas organivorans TaxID=257772 RepID=A0A7W5G4L2_9GAMM|nr:hypothetical protein [Halomonas organivorans]MBB3140224.1 hypothetical protein [Halomonas organivorans]